MEPHQFKIGNAYITAADQVHTQGISGKDTVQAASHAVAYAKQRSALSVYTVMLWFAYLVEHD
jgi:hypothetical protein